MPQPPAVIAASDTLAARYADAWLFVKAQEDEVLRDPARWGEVRRLAAIQRSIEARMAELDGTARAWIETTLPSIFAAGGYSTDTTFAWAAAVHGPTVAQLAGGLYGDLLSATSGVSESTKALIRAAMSRAGTLTVAGGQTAVQAAADAAAELRTGFGIRAVIYANGARVPLDAYAEMAVRTTTAIAYNRGALASGDLYYEVFDGPGCGWVEHDDPDEADGSIRSRDDCESFPVAHANCRRSFGARPDIATPQEAADAGASDTGDQSDSGDAA